MNINEDQRRPFSWDETPSQVFGDGLERKLVQCVRRSERELAAFLRQWCGTHFTLQTVEIDFTNENEENHARCEVTISASFREGV